MSAPSAIDAGAAQTNVQDVAIQSRILLSGDVTARLLEKFNTHADSSVDLRFLRQTLHVDAVPDTNLVEMIAEGSDSKLLPELVNGWIDVYLNIRAGDVQQNQAQTLGVVQDQLAGLSTRVDAARNALDAYRNENHISSAERQQNDELAQLDGLNAALNTAVKNEVKAKATLQSMQSALAAGKNVVSPSERKSVESMEKELNELELKMTKLKKIYTENYIRNQPGTREIPDRIAELKDELAQEQSKSQDLALAQAEQAEAAALQSVEDLQQKLDTQKEKAARFTTIYAKHEALSKDLEELETLYRDTQSRLVQVEVNQVEKHPQVSVIDRPDAVAARIGPDYLLLLGGSLGAALGVGILSVWLYGFLGPRPAKPAYVTLSGVHMYPQDTQHQLAYSAAEQHRLANESSHRLERNQEPERPDEQPPAARDAGGEPSPSAAEKNSLP
jgi:uncharacterized protein involved in exopolysaccharide biosynthesis